MKKTPSFWAQNPGNSSAQPYSQAGPSATVRGPGLLNSLAQLCARRPAAPSPQPGLGPAKCRAVRSPAWAARWPVHPAPLDLIRRPSDRFG